MTNLGKQLMLALGVAVLGTGAAFADDSGGDSGEHRTSPSTGDSSAVSHGKLIGDFPSPRDKYAQKALKKSYPPAEPPIEVIASAAKRGGHATTRSRDEAGT
jgi:hypothetical protein